VKAALQIGKGMFQMELQEYAAAAASILSASLRNPLNPQV
jgi:hypothetical protein